MPETILIVDDDPVQRRLLEGMVQRFGYDVVGVDGGQAALEKVLGTSAARIDCMVLDLLMADLDGFGVLAELRRAGEHVPVIVQTAHGGIDNVISAIRAGAVDFVVKPVGPERLKVSLRNALAVNALESELRRLKRAKTGTLTFKDIISRSARMQRVLQIAQKAAASDITVLLEGESGVGKELIARAIHGSSRRCAKPFVAVNCGAIPENLVESTLFGHERGVFAGAAERHIGKFVEASGGILFLDEVDELPLPAQVKVLRALQEGEVDTVGGRGPVPVDVRVVSASNRSLLTLVKEGRFREDLFYRLHVFPISVPPLRERVEDVPDLVRHFVARFSAEEGKRVRAVSRDAMALLLSCFWPGNVRQLENAIFRAIVLAESDELDIPEFPQIAAQSAKPTGQLPLAPLVSNSEEACLVPTAIPLGLDPPTSRVELGSESTTEPRDGLAILGADGELRPLAEIEADLVRFAIAHYDGQMSEIARRLQIGRSTLYRWLKTIAPSRDGAGSWSEHNVAVK
jgi:DNA-binding NtrC family response regulator